ncbi:MAG: nucleotidyltransferase family protein [Candidatus Krumholzibacteriia bacterium]
MNRPRAATATSVPPPLALAAGSRYLAELVRAFVAERPPPRPPDGLDAHRLVEQLGRRGVSATLGPLVTGLPADAIARLRETSEQAERRTTVLLLELERVLPGLDEVGAAPVVLKGAALALDVYPTPERRWFVDLDVLIAHEHREIAARALGRLGYQRHDPLPVEFYERHHFHRMLTGPHGACVELHWALTLPASVYSHDLDRLRRESRILPLGAGTMRVPGTVDQLLHGALQSVAGGYGDLRRIIDAALLDTRLAPGEHEQLAERARQAGLGTAVWLQYRLLEQIAARAMPPAVQELRPRDAAGRMLGRLPVAETCLVERSSLPSEYPLLLHWLCVPDARKRVRELGRFIWPGEAGLLEMGYHPGRLPGWRRRAWIGVRRLKTAAQLGGIATAWCLARPSGRP